MGAHRRPPTPHTWHIGAGSCRLCGRPVLTADGQPTRRMWHTRCAVEWRVMNQPEFARRAVLLRDKGRCRRCGQVTEDWQLDHRIPLALAPRDRLFCWTLGNMQTLCVDHHAEKTREDMARIRAARKPTPKDLTKQPSTDTLQSMDRED